MTTHRQTTGQHDNSTTALFHRQPTRRHDQWPTRQVTDNFLKTHRHSPTLTDRDFSRKRMKRNIFFNVNIALFSKRTHHHFAFSKHKYMSGAQWLSGRVLDSRPKGRGFKPHRCHYVVVLEQDTFILA